MGREQSDMLLPGHTSKTSCITFHGQPYAEDPVKDCKALKGWWRHYIKGAQSLHDFVKENTLQTCTGRYSEWEIKLGCVKTLRFGSCLQEQSAYTDFTAWLISSKCITNAGYFKQRNPNPLPLMGSQYIYRFKSIVVIQGLFFGNNVI